MFDINLVPEIQQQKQTLAKKNTYATIFGIVIVSSVVLVLVIIGSIKVGASISLNNTNDKITEVKATSEQYKELEAAVLSLEKGLEGVKQTMDGQNNWTLLLPHLEKSTPNDVQFSNLSIEGETITAQLNGRSVESIARFVQSYKKYQVLILRGSGTPQETINITIDSAIVGKTRVKSDGSWIYSTTISSSANQEISIDGETTRAKATYLATGKELQVSEGSMSSQSANLFKTVETKQYSKEAGTVKFDATVTVLTEALW